MSVEDTVVPASVLAELRGLTAGALPHRCYVYRPVRTRQPGGVTRVAYAFDNALDCRLAPARADERIAADQPVPGREWTVVFAANPPVALDPEARLVVAGETDGVAWHRTMRIIRVPLERAFRTQTKVGTTDVDVEELPALPEFTLAGATAERAAVAASGSLGFRGTAGATAQRGSVAAEGITGRVYVDSVAGSDANDGRSEAAPKRTLASAMASSPALLQLKRGSYWRDAVTLPSRLTAVTDYGTIGAPPELDGADVITPASFTPNATYPATTYDVTLSRDPAGVYVSGDTYMLWEDGAWLVRKTSLADVNATPGSFYVAQPNALSTPSVANVHPFGSTDPRSDGKTYEYSKRAALAEFASRTAVTVEGVHVTRGAGAYGSLSGGLDVSLSRVLVGKGGKHNTVCGSGTMEDVIAFDAETGRSVLADGGLIPFTWYRTDATGLAFTMRRCMSIFPAGRRANEALYAHGSGDNHHLTGTVEAFLSYRGGLLGGIIEGTQSYNDVCSLENAGLALKLTNNAPTITARRTVTNNTPVAGTSALLHPSASATVLGAAVEVCHGAHYKRADAAVTSGTMILFDLAAVVNFHHNVVRMDSGGSLLSMQAAQAGSRCKFNIFILNKAGAVLPYLQIDAVDVDCDYNVYIDYAGMTDYWQSSTTGTAFSLAEWRTESGKDLNSVVLTAAQADTLFLNGVAGIANGDFRLNPACALTFADGTPLVGNAGPQEFYNWNTRTVEPGQPFAFPTPPKTEAECKAYIADPTAWNFYP